MLVQYLEGIPGWEYSNGEIRFLEPDEIQNLEHILDAIENEQLEYFKISKIYSLTYHKFLDKLKNLNPNIIKGQVIGPITFLTSYRKKNGKLLISDDFYREVIPTIIKLKAQSQAKDFTEVCPMADKIIFFDEPILSQIGSAVLNLKKDDIKSIYNNVLSGKKGYFGGIHICGNSEWDFIMSLPFDIINFDAYSFSEQFFLYRNDIKRYVEEGGFLAFGVVPTEEDIINKVSLLEVEVKKNYILKELSGVVNNNIISERVFFTPSCGMGVLTAPNAIKVLEILNSISN